jgi:hypothetical protein
MIRIVLTIVLPLVLPTLLYLGWLAASRRLAPAADASWQSLPWGWLVAVGLVLTALALFFLNVRLGTSQGTYVPPRYIGGEVVPGHLVPSDSAK